MASPFSWPVLVPCALRAPAPVNLGVSPHMTLSRRLDAILAVAAALVLPTVVLLAGDPLYAGLWYYLAVPAVALGIGAAFHAKPLFLLGTSLAVATTLLTYMSINWSAERPEGLLALGHLTSLPGAAIGIVLALLVARRIQTPALILLAAFSGLLTGFFVNQLVVCNTVMWCGPLSLPV